MNYKQKVRQAYLTIQILILIGLITPANVFPQTQDRKLTAREIAQQTLPSTVSIVMANDKTDEIKSGSGFFVAKDIVVTNYHVIENTNKGVAKIVGEDKIYEILGTVGIDEKNDLALLKIKGVNGKPLKLNADDKTAIGDNVYAVGNPQGLEGTFSQCIVSSIRNNDKLNLLQITASISQGSSGGAVLNDKGEVVGVAVGAIEGGQSLNFAIPISFLRSLLSQQTSLAKLNNESSIFDKQTQPNSKKITKSPINVVPKESIPRKANRMQFKTSDLIEENLFGKVESIKESTYIPEKKFDEWALGEVVSETTRKYNLYGYEELYEKIVYSEPNELMSIEAYFNDCGSEFKLPYSGKSLYEYDYEKGIQAVAQYEKCAGKSVYKLKEKKLIKYQNGEVTDFDSAGKTLQKRITRNLSNGKVIVEYYNEEGQLGSKQLNYTNETEKTEEYFSKKDDKNEFVLSSKVIIAENKGEIKETHFVYGEFNNSFIYIKNRDTNLIIRSEFGGQINRKYEYEFDSQGNWIKRTEFESVTKFGKTYFEPTEVKIREIVYY